MRATIAAMLLVVAIPLLTAAAETCQQSEICIYPGFAPEITPQTAHPATATTQTTTTSTTSTLPSTGTAQTGKATQTTATTTAKTTGTAQATRGFICPVTVSSSAEITSRINPARVHPGTGKVRPHNGLDIGKPLGTPVLAAAAGTVTTDRYEATGYGNYIIISHAGGIETRYAHLSSSSVRESDKVTQGQEIGKVGSTPGKPYSTGPHLHFELREGGKITKKPEDICVPGKTGTAAKTGTSGKTQTAESTTPSSKPSGYTASSFDTKSVQLPGVGKCVSQTERACPQTGTKQARGSTWRTADSTCIFKAASQGYQIPYALLRAVLAQESGNNQFAVSRVGASGYTQLMPGTASGLGIGSGKLFDPYYNICGGVQYLGQQLTKFGSVECALAAYNAGPAERSGTVQRKDPAACRNHPYGETRNYVQSIMAAWDRNSRIA